MSAPSWAQTRPAMLVLWGIPCGMLLLAMADWPYSYYMVLRFVVCGFAAYFAFAAHKLGDNRWAKPTMAANVVLALLYNPFLQVHFGDKDLWTVVNLATVAAFTATVAVLWGRAAGKEKDPLC